MRSARLCIVLGGGALTFDPGWGRCCDLWPWPGGAVTFDPGQGEVFWPLTLPRGRCCDLCPGHGGGVVTFDPGWGSCCDLWPWPGAEGVVILDPSWGWEVVDLWCCPPPPSKYYRMTDACENIAFARYATRVVLKRLLWEGRLMKADFN